jgi:hypothetical protein
MVLPHKQFSFRMVKNWGGDQKCKNNQNRRVGMFDFKIKEQKQWWNNQVYFQKTIFLYMVNSNMDYLIKWSMVEQL